MGLNIKQKYVSVSISIYFNIGEFLFKISGSSLDLFIYRIQIYLPDTDYGTLFLHLDHHPLHSVHHPVHQEGVLAFCGSFCDRATFVKSFPRLDCPSSTNNPQTLSLFTYLPGFSHSQMSKKLLNKNGNILSELRWGWGLTILFFTMTLAILYFFRCNLVVSVLRLITQSLLSKTQGFVFIAYDHNNTSVNSIVFFFLPVRSSRRDT